VFSSSLSIERLVELCGHDFVRIGLGATLYPLEEAARFLVGYNNGEERECYIVDATWDKKMEFTTICPVKDIINTSDEKIENAIYKILDSIIKKNKNDACVYKYKKWHRTCSVQSNEEVQIQRARASSTPRFTFKRDKTWCRRYVKERFIKMCSLFDKP